MLIFVVVWLTLSYIPIAHMVWGGGLLASHGALDFAGGTVVHINAAIAGLVGAYLIGKRVGFGKEAFKPHNLPMVFTGTAILYIGWFGFNAGSAGTANEIAALAFVNTVVATAAAIDPEIFKILPASIYVLVENPICAGGLTAILLNIILPGGYRQENVLPGITSAEEMD